MANPRSSSTRSKRRSKLNLDLYSVQFVSTPIFRAIASQNPGLLLSAIHQGEDVTVTDPDCSTTYLHVVVQTADALSEEKLVPMVYQLANAGVDVNAHDYKMRTALELAIVRQLQHLMAALMRVGVDPSDKDYKAMIKQLNSPIESQLHDMFEKYEPGLWASVAQNNTAMVHMLVNSWCRVNINKNGITLLQFARGTNKSEDLVQILDDFEVTMEFVHATMAGDEVRMLEFLMDSKPCDPYIMDISFQESWTKPLYPRSLRDAALAMGHTHVLQLLPESDSEMETQTKVANRTQDDDTPQTPSSGSNKHEEADDSSLFDGDSTFDSSFEQESIVESASTLSSRSSTTQTTTNGKQTKTKNKKPLKISNGKRKSKDSETNHPASGDATWESFYYHPDSYLQVHQKGTPHLTRDLRGKALRYVVHDYHVNWQKPPPKSKSKSKEIKSKMCVIS